MDAFKKRLGEKTDEQFEIFVDYMELVRLRAGEQGSDGRVSFRKIP